MSIKVFPTQKKLTDDDAKLDVGHKHVTGQEMLGGKVGLDVLPKAIFPVDGSVLSTRTVDAGSSDRIVVSAGHTAKKGDVLRFTSGALQGIEAPVNAIDGDDIILATELDSAPLAGDEFLVMRHITLTIDENGSLSVSSGPAQFIKDAVNTTVNYDTVTPANNTPMPNQLFVMKDGVAYPVEKDTVTPANTLSIPVEIVGTSGTEINITAGDIGVQLQHSGANPDSVQIGDGTEIMAINASNEALVHDTDMLAELNAISNDQLVASLGRLAAAASSSIALSTEDKAVLDAIDTDLSSIDGKLPATLGRKGEAASLAVAISSEDKAVLDTMSTLLTNINNKLPSPLGRSAAITSLAVAISNEDKAVLDSINTKLNGGLPSALGRLNDFQSLSVVLSTQDANILTTISNNTSGIATTNTKLDSVNTNLNDIEVLLANGLPGSLGRLAAASSQSIALSTEDKAVLDTLLTEATFTGRIGEVSATPTANTVLGRLKDIDDAHTALLAELDLKLDETAWATRFGEVAATPTANTLLGRLDAIEADIEETNSWLSTLDSKSEGSIIGSVDQDTSAIGTTYQNMISIPINKGHVAVQVVNNSGNTIFLQSTLRPGEEIIVAPGAAFKVGYSVSATNPGVENLQVKSATATAGNLYVNLIGA